MTKIKVSEATGTTLDWLVAKCEGKRIYCIPALNYPFLVDNAVPFNPSTDWAQGGPIGDREDIEVVLAAGHHKTAKWMAVKGNNTFGFGETKLIATMRCYVVSKLGDEVELPVELVSRL
jgi:Protein of unknown function (DUF2591)